MGVFVQYCRAADQVSQVKSFVKIPLTLPSPARGEGFLIPLP